MRTHVHVHIHIYTHIVGGINPVNPGQIRPRRGLPAMLPITGKENVASSGKGATLAHAPAHHLSCPKGTTLLVPAAAWHALHMRVDDLQAQNATLAKEQAECSRYLKAFLKLEHHRRERAAFLLSEALRLRIVPPTIIREGPLGTGSLQWFVDADHREHYFTIHEQRPDLHDRLRGIAALDFVANNTDRKSGHCLLTTEDVWAIDNGLCFSEEFKLRTVIWDFAGDPIDPELISRLRALAERLPADIAALLSEAECAAVGDRARELAELGSLPYDETGRRYPWPLV